MAEHKGVSVDKLAGVYVKIRDKKSEIKAAFDEEYNKLTGQQDIIKQALLDYCKEQGLEGFKTAFGTVSRTVRTKYWTSNWDDMYKFIEEHHVPEFFEKRLNQTSVRLFLEENPDVVPKGLNVNSEYSVSVTKPRKARKPRSEAQS